MPENEIDMASIEAELAELEKQMTEEPAETPAETPTETPIETPAEVAKEVATAEDESDLTPAVQSWLARQTPEKRQEVLKNAGYEVAESKKIAKDEENVAKGAVKQTAEQMLDGIMAKIPQEMIPEGFDDLEPHQQSLVAAEILSEMKAEAKKNEAMAPFLQQQAQAELAQVIQNTATGWAQELGQPDAAKDIHAFISQFPPEDVERFKRDAQAGGSQFTYMVAQEVKRIVDGYNKNDEAATAKPLPNAADVGGMETDTVQLSKDAQVMYDDAKKLGLDEGQLKDLKKELAGVK